MAEKKAIKFPVTLRILRKIFPAIERISPSLANKISVDFFFKPIKFKPTPKENESFEKANHQFLKVGNKKIMVYSWGESEGKPVLMTHGWMGRGTQFRKFVKPFNDKGYQLVAFDGPAHGRSGGSKTHMGEFKDAIIAIQEAYGPFEASIGHSFGGGVNMYAAIEGVSIKKMILISAPAVAEDILENYMAILNGNPERIAYIRKYVRRTFNIDFNDTTTYVMSEKLDPLPMLLIHDRDDTEVPIKHSIALQSKLEYPVLIETKGLGHNRILKDKSVIESCLDFIINDPHYS